MTLQSSGSRVHGSDAIAARLRELAPWFHNLHLPTGHQTAPDHPLGDFPQVKWRQIRTELPVDLTGWTVVDVGCNAGFYSFELARRGADVVGIDTNDHYLAQARWARSLYRLDDRLESRRMGVYELARQDERFDLVLFMGVLYHLRHPLLALDVLAEKVDRLLLLQTLTMPGDESAETPAGLELDERRRLLARGWPAMAFVEHRLAGDPTNWWAPNHACVEAMLRSCGLHVIARPADDTYLCVPTPQDSWLGEWVHEELDRATGR